MSRAAKITLTNMCMVYDKEKDAVLIQNKTDDDDWKGLTFPGGHVEDYESCTDAVIREIFEETGLTISSPKLCGVKDWVNEDGSRYMVLLYKTDAFSGTLQSSEEGEVFWMSREELMKQDLDEDRIKLFTLFFEDSFSELFYAREENGYHLLLK